MKINCLICNEDKNIKYIDDYKFEVEYDVNYFGKLKIFSCDSCDVAFVGSPPTNDKLENFYKNVYRSDDRPHNHDYNNSDKNYLDDRFLNYILYLSTLLDFNKIKDVFDYGAGIGDLGFLLKKKYPHLNLYCNENDDYSLKILEKRGYKNFRKMSEIDKKFDLIISLHCIEHLSNLNPLYDLKKILKIDGNLFIEVPNCPRKKYFDFRPYDSPHLIFFTKKSCEKVFQKMSMQFLDLSYSSYDLDYAFSAMKESKKIFGNWHPNKKNLRNSIKKIIPNFLINLRRKVIQFNRFEKNDRSIHFLNNNPNSWCIRALLKNKA